MQKLYIAIGAVALIGVVFITGQMFASHPVAPAATAQYSDEVLTLGSWIDSQTVKYNAAVGTVADLQKQITVATQNRDDAHGAAQGYRKALCIQYHLSRVNNQFVAVTDCSLFQ